MNREGESKSGVIVLGRDATFLSPACKIMFSDFLLLMIKKCSFFILFGGVFGDVFVLVTAGLISFLKASDRGPAVPLLQCPGQRVRDTKMFGS